jgi:hypothetical protein
MRSWRAGEGGRRPRQSRGGCWLADCCKHKPCIRPQRASLSAAPAPRVNDQTPPSSLCLTWACRMLPQASWSVWSSLVLCACNCGLLKVPRIKRSAKRRGLIDGSRQDRAGMHLCARVCVRVRARGRARIRARACPSYALRSNIPPHTLPATPTSFQTPEIINIYACSCRHCPVPRPLTSAVSSRCSAASRPFLSSSKRACNGSCDGE